jgi:hypothetical protein
MAKLLSIFSDLLVVPATILLLLPSYRLLVPNRIVDEWNGLCLAIISACTLNTNCLIYRLLLSTVCVIILTSSTLLLLLTI